jgi:hypothetical protein
MSAKAATSVAISIRCIAGAMSRAAMTNPAASRPV